MSNYYICSFESYLGRPSILQRIRANSFSDAQDLFIQRNKRKLSYGSISAKLGDYAHGMVYNPSVDDEEYDEEDEEEEWDDEECDDDDFHEDDYLS